MKKSVHEFFQFTLLVFLIIFVTSCSKHDNQSWLQFRGTNALGIAPKNSTPPTDFGINKNVLWKIESPEGLSSPILIGDNLVLTGVNREEKKYLIWNIDSKNGAIKWKNEVAVEKFEEVHNTSSPAAATPVSDGERIYCYFPSFGLICFDLDGNKIWEKHIELQSVISGSGTSPVLSENKLILNYDNLVEPRLMVFDKSNGLLLWEYHFRKEKVVSSCSWSTPVIWNDQIIIHRSNGIEGIDMNLGRETFKFHIGSMGESTPVIIEDTLYVNAWIIRGEKELQGNVKDFQQLFSDIDANGDDIISRDEFRLKYPAGRIPINERAEGEDVDDTTFYIFWWMLRAFDDNKDALISKVEWKDFMLRMEDFNHHGLVAIQLGDTADITLSSQLWRIEENIGETPSLLVSDGLVYMTKTGGITTCVNAHSGDIMYSEKLGASGPYFSSPLLANGIIYYASYNGKITLVKAGEKFEILNQVDLNEKIGASPIALDDILYIRSASHLFAFKAK